MSTALYANDLALVVPGRDTDNLIKLAKRYLMASLHSLRDINLMLMTMKKVFL